MEGERKMYEEKIRSLEENMRFLEEIMKDTSPSGPSPETVKNLEDTVKQYEEQLKIADNRARESMMELTEGKKVISMKSQKEVELGKVIKHLEMKYMSEIEKHGETMEEMRRMQLEPNISDGNVWRERFMEEE